MCIGNVDAIRTPLEALKVKAHMQYVVTDHNELTLTLLTLQVIGGGGVFASGQRTGEQHIRGGRRVLRTSKAGISPPTAQ